MSISGWLDKWNVIDTYGGMLLSLWKEWTSDTCYNTDEPPRCDAEGNMAVTKEQVLFVFTHMSYTVNFIETERRLWLSGMGLGWWSLGWVLVVTEFWSGKMKRFWRQTVVMAAPQSECTSCCWTVHLKMGTGIVLGFVYFTSFFFLAMSGASG